MKHLYFLPFTLLILLSSCGPKHYITSSYHDLAPRHKTIAIIPFDNIYVGRQANNQEAEQLAQQLESEAYVFQTSLYHQILRRSRGRDKDIQIKILDLSRTNTLLEERYPTYEDIIAAPASEIAEVLGVDAIVKVTVYKNQFFSTGEKFGIEVASQLLINSDVGVFLGLGRDANQDEVEIYASIIDGKKDLAIWSLDEKCRIEWDRDADDIVTNINNKISRKFPYRKDL